tara:strand:- start:380 stop:481 length:102 start_codon:yes stop_codon:yes gene_type:complete
MSYKALKGFALKKSTAQKFQHYYRKEKLTGEEK